MKNIKFSFTGIVLMALLPSILAINACTKNFEAYNTDPNGITDDQLKVDFNNIGAFYPSIENAVTATGTTQMINIELGDFMTGGAFGGYFQRCAPNLAINDYVFFGPFLQYGMFDLVYNSIMSPINEIKYRGAQTSAPDFWAVALILRVEGMQKVTDIYGPVPYSKFGQGGTSVAYDSQQAIYDAFFSELDEAVSNLKDYIAKYPGAKPFKRFDKIYGGDYTLWLRYANSLRLRLAMQIVKIDPAKAKLQAEKAVDAANGGVFTSNADNAFVSGGQNALDVSTHIWGDIRSNAAIISYMNGYTDPRLGKYFEPSTISPGNYIGIRSGAYRISRAISQQFSNVSIASFTPSTPLMSMTASEAYFLRAEGALRGWNMGGSSAQQLYEDGITTSLTQWGVTSNASVYINDATKKPANYVDPTDSRNNIDAFSSITIKWDEAATNEQKLERIITQKWIATFPQGTPAWSTFRRTGYPKLFPNVVNGSGGTISTDIQIRRMVYPSTEYVNNPAEVAKGVTLLGGPDNGGTRLWWDVNKGNF